MASREQDKPTANLLKRSLASGANAEEACPDPEILAAYFERSLDSEETARHDLHFSQCARCREQLAAMVRADELVGSAYTKPEQSPGTAWIWNWLWLAPVAAAALVIMVVLVARRPAPQRPAESPLVAMSQSSQSPAASVAPEPKASAYSAPPADSIARSAPNPNLTKSETASSAKSALQPGAQLKEFAVNAPPSSSSADARSDAAEKSARVLKAQAPDQTGGIVASGTAESVAATASREAASDTAIGASSVSATPAEPASPRNKQPVSAIVATNHSLAQNQSVMVEAKDDRFARILVPTPDPQIVWRFSSGRFVERSSDAGATWHAQWTNADAHLIAGAAPSAETCWLVGRGGIILLTTDGKKWKSVEPPVESDFTDVVASNASAATITATDGRKFTTTDGGKHWTLAP